MAKVFLVDVARCNGCYNCQIVCKDEHCGNDWRPYAAEQPETGHFWLKILEKERGQVPVVRVAYTPLFCAHCSDAPCAQACPESAFLRREDGLLLLSPEACTGCKACLDACPQQAIYFNDELGIAQKCTGCAHLLDNGWDVPRCVDACPHEAIRYEEQAAFGSLLEEAELWEPVAECGSKVYYLNLPKRFVAGCAVDFEADEVLIGAEVSLLDSGSLVARAATDEFGDFKFDQVEEALYTVRIEMEGYDDLELCADVREKDLSLGDLGLKKQYLP